MIERLELHVRIINPRFFSVAIHQRKLQVLATKIFKAKNNLSPEIMKEFLI